MWLGIDGREKLGQADNYDDAPGAWPGVNGDKRAAEQLTTMMHQAVGLVPSEKGSAVQSTTTVSRACGLVLMGVKSSPPTSYI